MQAVQQTNAESPSVQFPANALINSERWLIGSHLFFAFAALALGIVLGPYQTLRRAPGFQMELIDLPVFSYYYQALTAHGVLNALVFTTFFIMGTSYFITQRSLQRPLKSMQAAWAAFGLMTIGLVLAAGAIISGQANVLYTFYAPMVAHWTFYLGLTLVIVGTWVGLFNVIFTYFDWRRDNPDQAVPLAVFAVLANFIMWFTASLGVAVEVLTMLLPLSLGIIDTTDAQVSRILFWFFGHPLVYFWLIPAYISWYTMLPKQLGVKLFSDSMGRVAFLMLMIFSIPIGVHHLFVDPGISQSAKLLHSALTFVVAVPSFLTAFNIGATLERAGRKRGGKGLFGWMITLPWGDPVVASQLMGMLLFAVGGITGVMNASFNINLALHNTTWVVGHFHMTLAGAVFMTYIGMTYWILPAIRRRPLWQPRLALFQAYSWFVGMLIFGASMGRAGIEGAIRRTDMGAPGAYIPEAAVDLLNWSAIGGIVLFFSSIALFAVILGTLFAPAKKENAVTDADFPIDTVAPKGTLLFFERWRIWIIIIIISNIIMWGPVLMEALDLVNGFWAVGNPGSAR